MLSKWVAVYIPSRFGPNQTIDESTQVRLVDMIANRLIDVCGGVTITEAIGRAKLSDGQGVEEDIAIVKSYYDNDAMTQTKVDRIVFDACKAIREYGQESIMVESHLGAEFR
jgi:hypothetical protein